MKKTMTLYGMLAAIGLFSSMLFISCETDEDTVTPEPKNGFVAAVIGGNNKSLTPGVNGYLGEPYDSAYTDANGDHYNSGIRYYQSGSGYYVSSREEMRFELINLWDTMGLNKDSMFHAYLFMNSLPWYTPTQVSDSTHHTGMRIMWRSGDGEWWTTSEGAQTGTMTVDTTLNTTVPGGISTHTVFVHFDCTLYQVNGSGTMNITEGKGRFSLINSMFY